MGLGLVLIFFGLVWGGIPTITVLGMVFNEGAPIFVVFPMLIFTVIGTVIVVTGIKKVSLAVPQGNPFIAVGNLLYFSSMYCTSSINPCCIIISTLLFILSYKILLSMFIAKTLYSYFNSFILDSISCCVFVFPVGGLHLLVSDHDDG